MVLNAVNGGFIFFFLLLFFFFLSHHSNGFISRMQIRSKLLLILLASITCIIVYQFNSRSTDLAESTIDRNLSDTAFLLCKLSTR